MLKLKFEPKNVQTKRVWFGAYGGHYSVVIVFKEKPKFIKDEVNGVKTKFVDLGDAENKNLIIGSIGAGEFEEAFGVEIDPDNIEITKVYEATITAPFDEFGHITSFNTNVDGY